MFKTIASYLVFLCLFDHIYRRLISPEIDTKLELRVRDVYQVSKPEKSRERKEKGSQCQSACRTNKSFSQSGVSTAHLNDLVGLKWPGLRGLSLRDSNLQLRQILMQESWRPSTEGLIDQKQSEQYIYLQVCNIYVYNGHVHMKVCNSIKLEEKVW